MNMLDDLLKLPGAMAAFEFRGSGELLEPVSYTHLRAHETVLDLVCRLLLEKKQKTVTVTAARRNLLHRVDPSSRTLVTTT